MTFSFLHCEYLRIFTLWYYLLLQHKTLKLLFFHKLFTQVTENRWVKFVVRCFIQSFAHLSASGILFDSHLVLRSRTVLFFASLFRLFYWLLYFLHWGWITNKKKSSFLMCIHILYRLSTRVRSARSQMENYILSLQVISAN